MRTSRVSRLLVSVLLLAFTNSLLPAFRATGQTVTLAAPVEVTASDSVYVTKVVIAWAPVRAATSYRIFRNTVNDPSTAVNLGATAEGSFSDTSGIAGQTCFYWVRAENGATVSSLSIADQGTRANGIIAGPVPPLNPPMAPPGNPVTAAKAYLGKSFFWDEQLSSTRTVACGTCHFASSGGSDSRAIVSNLRATNPGADGSYGTADDVYASPGVISNNSDGTYNWSALFGFREQVTGRKSRSYIDAAYANSLFWDGRATPVFTDPISGAVVLPNGAALESQVLGPPVSSAEMAHGGRDWNNVAARIATSKPLALAPSIPPALKEWIGERSYPEVFAEVFGTSEVTPARIAMAIATFERTLFSDRTPFDANVQQIAPLTQAEVRGQGVFNQSRCNVCHAGPLFSDNQFHNIGVRPQTEDTGRFQVTGNGNNLGEFRTPSLRNVELRGPYMHNGHFATLEEVVEFYNRGGDFDAPNINRNLIRPLNLSPNQKADLLAFLRRPLTDLRVATAIAPFDRPQLYSESNRVPEVFSSGVAGAGAGVPQVIAIEPPVVGNSNFTVAVANALGGAPAILVIDSSDPGTGPVIPSAPSFARRNIQLSGSGARQGFASISLSIPNDASLIGSTFYGRWFISEPNAPGGVAVSPAFKMTIFGDSNSTAATSNPIDDAASFVTQHYRDFLNREPDPGGFEYWTKEITGDSSGTPAACAITDAGCVTQRRIGVSGAFFVENEFQFTGSYVYRLYATSLGRQPTFAEFQTDRGQIAVGANLEPSKAAFADNWVLRPAFVARYGSNPSAENFVDALLATVVSYNGVDLTTKRATYIGELQGGAGRGQIVREVAEDSAVKTAEYNPSFVQMQYFGYLRRDPEPEGYAFWLNVINNREPNNYRGMICAFLTSAEYQHRFGSVISRTNRDCGQ